MRYLLLFVVLLVFWALLSGQLDYTDTHQRYLMICGVMSCALVTLLMRRVGYLDKEGNFVKIALRAPLYLIWLTWQIILSNLDVARRVWSPRVNIDPALVRAPYKLKTELAIAIYANSITLTPGTVTVEIDSGKKELLIHLLNPGGEAGLKPMHNKVAHLEGEGGEL